MAHMSTRQSILRRPLYPFPRNAAPPKPVPGRITRTRRGRQYCCLAAPLLDRRRRRPAPTRHRRRLVTITADPIGVFAYVKILDIIHKKIPKDLRDKCDCYVSEIIVGEDDVTYVGMIAKVLVPEFEEEIGLPEIAGGLGSKLMDLPKDAGKDIANCDKQEILQSLKNLSVVCKEKKRAHQRLLEIETQIGVARIAVGTPESSSVTVVSR